MNNTTKIMLALGAAAILLMCFFVATQKKESAEEETAQATPAIKYSTTPIQEGKAYINPLTFTVNGASDFGHYQDTFVVLRVTKINNGGQVLGRDEKPLIILDLNDPTLDQVILTEYESFCKSTCKKVNVTMN